MQEFGAVSAILVAPSWVRAAYGLAPGRYVFIKSQPHLCAIIGRELNTNCPKVQTTAKQEGNTGRGKNLCRYIH